MLLFYKKPISAAIHNNNIKISVITISIDFYTNSCYYATTIIDTHSTSTISCISNPIYVNIEFWSRFVKIPLNLQYGDKLEIDLCGMWVIWSKLKIYFTFYVFIKITQDVLTHIGFYIYFEIRLLHFHWPVMASSNILSWCRLVDLHFYLKN